MSQLLSLGAINKLTGEYVYPKIANKKDEYICLECNKDLILVQGEIRVHHFRHKVDSINPCHHYSKPTESQIHKDAKMLMKTLLENKTPIQFMRECVSCKKSTKIGLPEITEGSSVSLEHRFNYNSELKIADIAHTLNGEIKGIYEICHTHKTCGENRPEPWVEIDANSLLTLVNTTNEPLIINCTRCEKCENCDKNQKNKYNLNDIDDIYKFGILKQGDMVCDLCNKNIKCGDKIGWYKYSPDAYCEKCYIDKMNYIFITTKISIPPLFGKTHTLYMCMDRDIEEYDEIPLTSFVMVDCKNNFTKEEKTIINELKNYTIEDLIRNDKISKNDKQRCLKCFGYVRERYELMGIEPFNGHNIIQLEKYAIDIRILPDGIVKYCRSLGEKNVEKDFIKIQMGI
jgi:hypothetical protein